MTHPLPRPRPRRAALPILLVAALLTGCTAGPPAPTPYSERARVLHEYAQLRRGATSAQEAFNLMARWPGSGEIRDLYARLLYDLGALDQVEHQVQQALATTEISRESRAWVLYTQARVEMARRNWSAAAARCADALAIQPQARWEVMRRARKLQADAQRLQPLAQWPTYESRHCVIHYPAVSGRAANMAAYVADLAAARDAELERLTRLADVALDVPIHVYLHDSTAEIAQVFGAGDPHVDVRGYTIHEAPEHDGAASLARLVAAHLGEYLIFEPAVEAGLVAYLRAPDAPPADGPVLDMVQLAAQYDGMAPGDRAAAARGAVARLIEQRGMDTFKTFHDRLAWVPLADAVQKVYGASSSELPADAAAANAASDG